MALDQTLLESAAAGDFPPTLRFYRWSPPALSIGRFQPLSDVDLDSCAARGIEVVRRPTGGKSILHLDDFTYSIVTGPDFPLPGGVVEDYRMICRGILLALKHLGLEAAIQPREGEAYRLAGGACFAAITQADLELSGRKLCGSAQVRRRGALLQHGSILMEDRSELLFALLRFAGEEERKNGLEDFRKRCIALNHTGWSYTWPQVADAFARGFQENFDALIEEGPLTDTEKRRWAVLTGAYGSVQWLENAALEALPR